MTEELPITSEDDVPQEAVPTPDGVDLSAEIARTIARKPGDRVRVTRVWGNHYRCNWIAPQIDAQIDPPLDAQLASGSKSVSRLKSRATVSVLDTFHVRQSRFLRVTRKDGGALEIADLTLDRVRSN